MSAGEAVWYERVRSQLDPGAFVAHPSSVVRELLAIASWNRVECTTATAAVRSEQER